MSIVVNKIINMKFNPFSLLNPEGGKQNLYYSNLLARIFESMYVLNGTMENLGFLDYVLILPMLAKFLHDKAPSKLSSIISHTISIPKNILSFVGGILLFPITAFVHCIFVWKYKNELKKINNLNVSIKKTNQDSLITSISNKTLGEVLTPLFKKDEQPVDRYLIDYNPYKPDKIKIYPARACDCGFNPGKPHEASRDKTSKNPKITIPINAENIIGIESIFKVGAFFSEELSNSYNKDIHRTITSLHSP